MENILPLIMYLVGSYAHAKIGEKFGIGSMIKYFIPVYSNVLICRCAQVSAWWVLGLFVPYVNIAVVVYIYGSLATQLGKNFWINGLGSLVFGIPIFIMAWDKSKPVNTIQSDSSSVN